MKSFRCSGEGGGEYSFAREVLEGIGGVSKIKLHSDVAALSPNRLYLWCQSENMPNLYVIAGCNGAGKTTASYAVLPEMLECKEFVNADEIAKGLRDLLR